MTKKAAAGKISPALEKALAAEVVEIARRYDDDVYDADQKLIAKKGDFIYPALDRMRVYDRMLKLEAIKAKLPDADWGKEFK